MNRFKLIIKGKYLQKDGGLSSLDGSDTERFSVKKDASPIELHFGMRSAAIEWIKSWEYEGTGDFEEAHGRIYKKKDNWGRTVRWVAEPIGGGERNWIYTNNFLEGVLITRISENAPTLKLANFIIDIAKFDKLEPHPINIR